MSEKTDKTSKTVERIATIICVVSLACIFIFGSQALATHSEMHLGLAFISTIVCFFTAIFGLPAKDDRL